MFSETASVEVVEPRPQHVPRRDRAVADRDRLPLLLVVDADAVVEVVDDAAGREEAPRLVVLPADDDHAGHGRRWASLVVERVLGAEDRHVGRVVVDRTGLAVVGGEDGRRGAVRQGVVGRGDLADVGGPADRVADDGVDPRDRGRTHRADGQQRKPDEGRDQGVESEERRPDPAEMSLHGHDPGCERQGQEEDRVVRLGAADERERQQHGEGDDEEPQPGVAGQRDQTGDPDHDQGRSEEHDEQGEHRDPGVGGVVGRERAGPCRPRASR